MTLKIMTYNADMRGSKKPSLAGRISSLICLINYEQPDIICLQEFGSAAMESISQLNQAGHGYKHFVGNRDIVTLFAITVGVEHAEHIKLLWNITGGIPIFTKGTLIGKGYSIFKASCSTFQGGHPFSIVNTHLDPHDKNHEKRISAFQKMVHAQMSTACATHIVAGDFNEPNIGSLCASAGYSHDNKSMVTHHHNDNVRRKSKNQALRKDWVICKGATILGNSVATVRIKYDGEDVSDHSPVVTSLL